MFCVNLEDKTRNLEENLKNLRKMDQTKSLFDSFRDLEVQIKRINTLSDFLKVEDEVQKFNKLLGYEEKIDWDDCSDDFNYEHIEKYQIVKQVRFNVDTQYEKEKNQLYLNRPPSNLLFKLGILKELPKKKEITKQISVETKIYFIQLLKQISNSIIDLVHKQNWLEEIIKYEKMSLEDLYVKFRYNNIYELDIFLEKYNELQDVKITENKYVEKVLHSIENMNNGVMYSWFWELESKVDELLGTTLIKYRIIDMIKDIYLNNISIENENIRNEIMFENLKKLYDFVCKSEFDFYYDNLLIKLIEFKY